MRESPCALVPGTNRLIAGYLKGCLVISRAILKKAFDILISNRYTLVNTPYEGVKATIMACLLAMYKTSLAKSWNRRFMISQPSVYETIHSECILSISKLAFDLL